MNQEQEIKEQIEACLDYLKQALPSQTEAIQRLKSQRYSLLTISPHPTLDLDKSIADLEVGEATMKWTP